jgi:xylulokinase
VDPPARAGGSTVTDSQALSLVGGGARSAFWAQLLATVLDVPLLAHDGGEAGGALGAARLGWLADGGNLADVCRMPPVARRFEPDPSLALRLAPRAERFRRLYPALQAHFVG